MKTNTKSFLLVIFLIISCLSYAKLIHVSQNISSVQKDGSVDFPFIAIQDALQVAVSGDTIKVAEGIYNESLLIDDIQIALLGSYPHNDFSTQNYQSNPSTIHGDKTQSVIELRNQCGGSLIDGFVIQNGLRGIDFDVNYTWPPVSNITISNNIIEDNGWNELNDVVGGGLKIKGDDIILKNNIIRNNKAGRGGALSAQGANLQIENNLIDNNQANSDHGGGLYLYGNAHLKNNIISNNKVGVLAGYGWGGGVIFMESGSQFSTSEGNIYRHNSAPSYGGGVFVDEASTLYMLHDLVYGNTTHDGSYGGAGIAVDESGAHEASNLYMDLCTVAYNTSSNQNPGNGVLVDVNSKAKITNSIFYGNEGDFKVNSQSQLDITYSLTEDLIQGIGLIHVNPLFADAAKGDFHLKSKAGRYDHGNWLIDTEHSPAIDAGHLDTEYALETAPNGGRVNLGCYGNTPEASRSTNSGLENTDKESVNFLCFPNRIPPNSEVVFYMEGVNCNQVVIYSIEGKILQEINCNIRQSGTVKTLSPAHQGAYFAVFYYEKKNLGSLRFVVAEK